MSERPVVLFLDTASPISSVAAGTGGEVLARRTIEQRRTSELLLATIEEVLAEAGVAVSALYGIVALQGPGSFTGLRIGMATVMGLHQALAVRATALPTLPILALAVGPGTPGARLRPSGATDVLAAVDATRGDWVTQRFGADPCPMPLSEPELLGTTALKDRGPCRLVGFGTSVLSDESWFAGAGIELLEPPPLAAVAAQSLDAGEIEWRAERLTSPIYFRPPAVTLPTAATGAMIQKSR